MSSPTRKPASSGNYVSVDTQRPKEVDYSPIEHLAKTVALSRFDWKEVQLPIFTTAFDAAGTDHDQELLISQ